MSPRVAKAAAAQGPDPGRPRRADPPVICTYVPRPCCYEQARADPQDVDECRQQLVQVGRERRRLRLRDPASAPRPHRRASG